MRLATSFYYVALLAMAACQTTSPGEEPGHPVAAGKADDPACVGASPVGAGACRYADGRDAADICCGSSAGDAGIPEPQVISLRVHLSEYGEFVDTTQLEEQGWSFDEDESMHVYEDVFAVRDLPFVMSTGDFDLRVSAEGMVNLGCSFGDDDAVASGNVRLPRSDGRYLPLGPGGLHLGMGGGDNASGTWSARGSVEIHVD